MVGFLVGLFTGILSGFGVGGGTLLMLYLTMIQKIPQFTAAGINLFYFIFCAPPALVSHIKNKRIHKKAFWLCTLSGCALAILGSLLAARMDTHLLHRLFGGLLCYVGVRELLACRKSKNASGASKGV